MGQVRENQKPSLLPDCTSCTLLGTEGTNFVIESFIEVVYSRAKTD